MVILLNYEVIIILNSSSYQSISVTFVCFVLLCEGYNSIDVAGSDRGPGQSLCPAGLPPLCCGAPNVSHHTGPRAQWLLCSNPHQCAG